MKTADSTWLSLLTEIHLLNQRLRLLVAVLLLIPALGLWFVTMPDWPQKTKILILGLASIFCLTSFILLIRTLSLRNPAKMEWFRLLTRDRHRLVWVYSYNTVNMPFGVLMHQMVMVRLFSKEGTDFSFYIKTTKMEDFFQKLAQQCPQVTMGFSPEKEQLYLANPLLLKRTK